jgi:hypothetical protein
MDSRFAVALRCAAWAVALLVGAAAACEPPAAERHGAAVAGAWFDLHLDLARETPGFSPPVAARALAYAGVTLYEAVVPGMPAHLSLVGHLPGLTELPRPPACEPLHLPEVANAALAALARELYATARPHDLAGIDRLEIELTAAHASEVDAATLAASRDHGRALAAAIHAWAALDGGHQGQSRNYREDYRPPSGPGLWVPTPRAVGQPFPPLQPTWGANRPFAGEALDACLPPPPPAYAEEPGSVLHEEALEVVRVVRAVTPAQREIAQYWSDDAGATATPAGHWTAILATVLREQDASLAFAAEAHARLGMALSDAFVSCWDAKYRHNLLRPITYIQRVIDPTWNQAVLTDPLLTPPFPEYTSGHSVASAAAAQVLTELFGEDHAFVDGFHTVRGFPPRAYPSFWAAAEESALSRLYGGIHFRSAIEHGVEQGRCVAERIAAIPFLASDPP